MLENVINKIYLRKVDLESIKNRLVERLYDKYKDKVGKFSVELENLISSDVYFEGKELLRELNIKTPPDPSYIIPTIILGAYYHIMGHPKVAAIFLGIGIPLLLIYIKRKKHDIIMRKIVNSKYEITQRVLDKIYS